MARRDDEDTPWTRQLLVVLGVLLAVALVIGGVMSVVALGAAKVSGIDETQAQHSTPPRLVIPSGEPTTRPEPFPDPAVPHAAQAAPSPSASAAATPKKKSRAISLQALPRHASANERINLTGTYRGHEGARLQVQRYQGSGWQDFPVTVPVSGGLFHTYVYTSRTGPQRFRVVDEATGRRSNAVRVAVG